MSVVFSQASARSSSSDNLTRRLYCFHVRQWELRRGKVSDYGKKRMAVWDGGRDRNGAYHQPVWPRLNSHMTAHQLDAFRYMSLSFKSFGAARFPTPRQLIGAAALERYSQCLDPVGYLRHKLRVSLAEVPALTERVVYLVGIGRPVVDAKRAALVGASNLSRMFLRSVALKWQDTEYADSVLSLSFDEFLHDPSGYLEAWGQRYIDSTLCNLLIKEIRASEEPPDLEEEDRESDYSGVDSSRCFEG